MAWNTLFGLYDGLTGQKLDLLITSLVGPNKNNHLNISVHHGLNARCRDIIAKNGDFMETLFFLGE